MNRITRLILADILRNRIVAVYTVLLGLLSWSVFALEDNSSKGLLTLLNVVLLVVPLMSVLFSCIYIYNSSEFIELLVSQPLKRKQIWISLFAGLSLSLSLAFFLSAGIPLLLFNTMQAALILISTGILISVIFTALAFFAAIVSKDKAKGVGIALMLWIYFALLFDGLVLFLLFQFSAYPIEKPMVILSASSPLDLARILNLIQLDSAAMLGYTGAIFRNYFGSGPGLLLSYILLLLWALVPFLISLRIFSRKDL